ncbi:hypothetical protein PINS_up022969 [Pythium insidiosum]|nr:hypothetical protein PINS_up022969 [Pythium insidiosum]
MQRKLSSSSVSGRPSIVSTELRDELLLVKRNIFSRKPWKDGLHVMTIVIANTITSVVVGWFVALLYAVGSPFHPRRSGLLGQVSGSSAASPAADRHFYGAVGCYFVTFACLGHLVTKSYQHSERLMSFNTTMRRQSFRSTLRQYFAKTTPALLISISMGSGLMIGLHEGRVQFLEAGRFHLFLLCMCPTLYVLVAHRKIQRLRRRSREISTMRATDVASMLSKRSSIAPSDAVSTVGPLLSAIGPTVGAQPSTPLHRDLQQYPRRRRRHMTMCQRLWKGRLLPLASFLAAFGYLHLSSNLRIKHQWQLLFYAAFSLTFKIMLQEATKRFQLHAGTRMPSARAIHMTMTIPTVALDAQIRMAFVQLGGAGQSSPVTNSLAIVFSKVVFRLAKILRLRAMIKGRLDKSKGMKRMIKRVNSKIALKDVAAARAEYSRFLDWKNYMLKLHAAEVYADMHGEYISIGLSMAIVTLLSNHEMYDITRDDSVVRQILAAAIQMVIGLAFDYISSVVEGVHEVPLYESIDDEGHGLRIFIHVLLGALTAINTGVIAAFALRFENRINS